MHDSTAAVLRYIIIANRNISIIILAIIIMSINNDIMLNIIGIGTCRPELIPSIVEHLTLPIFIKHRPQ